MKTKIISLLLILFVSYGIKPQKASAQVYVNFQVFYDELSPYGQWVDYPNYGYVWVPNVGPGFSPYATNGYWVFTDWGWTWVSDYSWGWAPFHYGRWYIDPYYGPVWIPGNEWGPGWVNWRGSEGYYGWAPMGPGYYGNDYYSPYNQWTFVRVRDFGSPNINNYYVNNSNNVTIINNTTVINNFVENKNHMGKYNAGPDRKEVEKHLGKTIAPIAIKESNTPGQVLGKDQLQIYRPVVQKNNASGPKPAPAKITKLKDVKPIAQRTATTQPQNINKPDKQQPSQSQHIVQPTIQKPSQLQQTNQSQKGEGIKQQQHPVQPGFQKPSQPQQTNPSKKGESVKQPQHNVQPTMQKPSQPQQTNQPQKMEGTKQPQHQEQQNLQKQEQHQQANPPKKDEGLKQSQQAKSPQNKETKKQINNDKERPTEINQKQNTEEKRPPR